MPTQPPEGARNLIGWTRAFLRAILTPIVAMILLFEEWGWEPLSAALARLARLPFLAQLELRIRSLPPWAAMSTFALPVIALFPIKVLALLLIAAGHGWAGLGVLIAAKVVGTAIVARLFNLTQPALMRVAWFARCYPLWIAWKNRVLAQVRASAMWTVAADWKRRWRAWYS